MDIDNKLSNYLKITCIINNVFRPKKIRIKLYNTLALPNWTIKARDATITTAADMIRTAGYTWTDHKTNTETAKELNITPVWIKYRTTRKNGYNM